VERMEKKNREEGERGRRPAAFEGAQGHGAAREKGGEGGWSARCRVGAGEGGRGGPYAAGLTGGTVWQRDPMGSDGVREVEEKARQCGGGHGHVGPASTVPGRGLNSV
jgi:hypothetical protein